MGSGASIGTIPITFWSVDDVHNAVLSMGEAYAPYALAFKNNGIDGNALLCLDDSDLDDLAGECEVKNIHKKLMLNKLKELKALGVCTGEEAAKVDGGGDNNVDIRQAEGVTPTSVTPNSVTPTSVQKSQKQASKPSVSRKQNIANIPSKTKKAVEEEREHADDSRIVIDWENQVDALRVTTRSIRPRKAPTIQDIKECYHIFLGYRVATEEALTTSLYDKLIVQSGSDPHLRMAPNAAIVRPYLDKKCLKDGEPWADGFSAGLAHSCIFCPVMSWHEDSSSGGQAKGSVGGLNQLRPEKGVDWIDNVLLEYEFALAIAEYQPLFLHIVPVLLGPADSRGFTEFPFTKLSGLSHAPSMKTKMELVKHCRNQGIPLSHNTLKRSIHDTVQELLAYQGKQIWKFGSVDVATETVATHLLEEAAKRVSSIKREDLSEVKVVKRRQTALGASIELMRQNGATFYDMWACGYTIKEIRIQGKFSGQQSIAGEHILHTAERNGLNSQGDGEDTPLIASIKYGCIEVANALLQRGADVDLPVGGNTPLMYAAEWQDASWISLLLQYSPHLETKNDSGMTALHVACSVCTTEKDLELIRLLLEAGADEEAEDDDGNKVIMYARNRDVAQSLLGRGVDINVTNDAGEYAATVCVNSGNYETAQLLMERNGKCSMQSLSTASTKQVLAEHDGSVCCVAFDNEGKRLASGSRDHQIRIWAFISIDSENEVEDENSTSKSEEMVLHMVLKGHEGEINSVCFSSNNKIASASDDCTVRIWSLLNGEVLTKIIQAGDHWAWSISFSLDCEHVIVGSSPKTINIYNVDSGNPLMKLKGHTEDVFAVAFSPDGRHVASCGKDNTIKLWVLKTQKCIATLTGHSLPLWSIDFSKDGSRIISGSDDATAIIWNVEELSQIHILKEHSKKVSSVAFSPDGEFTATASTDLTAKLWHARNGECKATFKGHTDELYCVTFNPAGTLIATGGYDHTIRLWDCSSESCLVVLADFLKSYTPWITFKGNYDDGNNDNGDSNDGDENNENENT